MTFPQALRHARETVGLTQTELGNALGVSFSTINRYENGKHFPTPIVMNAIQSYFGSKGIPFEFKSAMEENAHHGCKNPTT